MDESRLIEKTGITARSLIRLRNQEEIYFFKNHDDKYYYNLEEVRNIIDKNPDLRNKHWRKNIYRVIDLFAGIGGLRIGLTEVFDDRCVFVFSNEIDKFCSETYIENFNDNPLGDITKINPREIPDFDILLAGFPCQPFSIAGKKEGFNDKKGRGNLFYYIKDILKEKKPDTFLLENVGHFAKHDKGRTFKTVKSILKEDLGYYIYYKNLNAKHFGLPQNRERIFIVGFKDDVNFRFPEQNKNKQIAKISSVIEKVDDPKYFLSQKYWDSLQRHRKRHEKKGHGFGYEILDKDGIANALVVGGMGLERNLIKEKDTSIAKNKNGIRRLTPRECAKIQGFPDDFKIPVSDTQAYKQFANAVPIPVIKSIAKEILRVLDEN